MQTNSQKAKTFQASIITSLTFWQLFVVLTHYPGQKNIVELKVNNFKINKIIRNSNLIYIYLTHNIIYQVGTFWRHKSMAIVQQLSFV